MSVPRSDEAEVLTVPYQGGRAIGHSQWCMGMLFTWFARAEDTGGLFSLVDVRLPAGTEAPPHTHTHEDEAVVVVDGDVTYRAGEKIMRVTSGQYVYLPRGFEHGFTLNSSEAHLLILITPAGLEATFDQFSQLAPALTLPPPPAGPPAAEFIDEITARFSAAGVRFGSPAR
jgi:quercetin dioxygenase-like cupin family protein